MEYESQVLGSIVKSHIWCVKMNCIDSKDAIN